MGANNAVSNWMFRVGEMAAEPIKPRKTFGLAAGTSCKGVLRWQSDLHNNATIMHTNAVYFEKRTIPYRSALRL